MTVRSVFAISMFALAAGATDVAAQARSTTSGFHLGAGLNFSSIKVDEDEDIGIESERESGAGINLMAGYNFTPRFGVVLNIAGANISSEGGDYGLGHADLTGRFSIANPASPLVPYLELGVSSIALVDEDDDTGDDVTVSGTGFTGAAGLNYFFSPKLALDANLRYSMGELDTIKIGGNSQTVDDGVNVGTARLNVGISWFPGGGR